MSAVPPATTTAPPGATEAALAPGLAFTAGYVDTIGFVALHGLFTAHVTGNFVLIGASIVHGTGGVALKLLAFPAFILGVVIARLLDARGSDDHARRRSLFLLQAVLLAGFAVLGAMLHADRVDPDTWAAYLTGMTGALAMGVQNAASRLTLTSLVPTTVMTGNVTQLVLDAVDLLRRDLPPAARATAAGRARRMLPAVAGFALGALGGAVAYLGTGFWALLLPAVGIAILGCRRPREG